MTELVSLFDPSIRECEAVVAASGDGWFIPDRTCFYPEGGGLPADRGTYSTGRAGLHPGGNAGSVIGRDADATDIIDAQKSPEGIRHFTSGGAPVPGAAVALTLDWNFGHAIRRYHTALHVLCGTIWKMYGVKVTGAQVKSDGARMDFGFPDWKPEYRDEIERAVNEALATDAEVRIYSLPAAEARRIPDLIRTDIDLLPKELSVIRIVQIAGIDLQADGGPHVRTLSEVGTLRIKKAENKGKGFRMLEVELG